MSTLPFPANRILWRVLDVRGRAGWVGSLFPDQEDWCWETIGYSPKVAEVETMTPVATLEFRTTADAIAFRLRWQ